MTSWVRAVVGAPGPWRSAIGGDAVNRPLPGGRVHARDSGLALSNQRKLRCLRKLGKRGDAAPDNAIVFLIKSSDFPRSHPVLVQIVIGEVSLSSQYFDLQVNQLKDFTFDSGGWIRHHGNSPGKL